MQTNSPYQPLTSPSVQKTEYADHRSTRFNSQRDAFDNAITPDYIVRDATAAPYQKNATIQKRIGFPFGCGADGTQLLRSNTSRMPMSLFYSVLSSIDLSNFAYARHFKHLKEQKVLLPDERTAQAFTDFANRLREQIRSLIRKNNNLRHTRDLLLPKLISGELDIDIGVAA